MWQLGAMLTGNLAVSPDTRAKIPARPLTTESMRVMVYLVQMLLDLLAICLAFAISALIRHGTFGFVMDSATLITLLPVFAIVAFYSGAYSYEAFATRVGIERVLSSLALALAFNALTSVALKDGTDISRLFLFVGVGIAALLISAERLAVQWFVGQKLGARFIRRVLVIDGETVEAPPGYEVLDMAALGIVADPNDPHALHQISSLLYGADQVVVSAARDRRETWSLFLKGIGCNGELLLPELHAIGHLSLDRGATLAGIPVSTGRLDIRSRLLKRLFDLAITVPAIIVLTPLMLVIAVLVKLSSPGPVLFRQRRMGRSNRLFDVYKFRTMREESCDSDGRRSTSRDDDRITPLGRILRRTSLDELPQLFNVVEGDMSLVGPRPHALGSLAGDQLFWHVDRRYWLRHAIKPGITGLAQVRGFRGATDHRDDLMLRLQCDLEYASRWSLFIDAYILLRTFAVLVHKRAY